MEQSETNNETTAENGTYLLEVIEVASTCLDGGSGGGGTLPNPMRAGRT